MEEIKLRPHHFSFLTELLYPQRPLTLGRHGTVFPLDEFEKENGKEYGEKYIESLRELTLNLTWDADNLVIKPVPSLDSLCEKCESEDKFKENSNCKESEYIGPFNTGIFDTRFFNLLGLKLDVPYPAGEVLDKMYENKNHPYLLPMFSQKYKEVEEAVSAGDWLKKTRPYLFSQHNPNFIIFDDYLISIFKIYFDEIFILDDQEFDAGGFPNENCEMIHIHRRRWEQRPKKSNSALMVHELTEAYLQYAAYTFFPQEAHIIAEFFEGEFRKEAGLPPCPEGLPTSMIPKMRKFEQELEQKVKTMEHYDVNRLLLNGVLSSAEKGFCGFLQAY